MWSLGKPESSKPPEANKRKKFQEELDEETEETEEMQDAMHEDDIDEDELLLKTLDEQREYVYDDGYLMDFDPHFQSIMYDDFQSDEEDDVRACDPVLGEWID
eukprot:UN19343